MVISLCFSNTGKSPQFKGSSAQGCGQGFEIACSDSSVQAVLSQRRKCATKGLGYCTRRHWKASLNS